MSTADPLDSTDTAGPARYRRSWSYRAGDLLRYFRFYSFQRILQPFQRWARRRRMRLMVQSLGLTPGTRVLDLGGQPGTWDHEFVPPLDITILNLPGIAEQRAGFRAHRLAYVEGDACNALQFQDKEFNVVFSNSVIEHVGGPERRARFAREIQRLGRSFWVQTPSIWFPVEAHTGMPFWWLYPQSVRALILRRWQEKLPNWTDMVRGTTIVRKSELKRLFPNARIMVERVLGVPKSYIVLSPPGPTGR